jgi:hypothetical protein
MTIMKTKQKLVRNEQGLVSIIITILIILMLSLIVLAMSSNANRERRQSLDAQLSSQAFYAAESGINDAREYLKQTNAAPQQNDCADLGRLPGGWTGPTNGNLGDDVAYTCVMFDATPDSLQLDKIPEIGEGESKKILVKAENSDPLGDVTFSWKQSDGSEGFTSCPAIGQHVNTADFSGRDCGAGFLSIGLIDPTKTDRIALLGDYFLALLVPRNSTEPNTGTQNYTSSSGLNNQGSKLGGNCNGGSCTVTINIPKNGVVLHVRSIYSQNDLTLTRSGGSFVGGQAVVDVTGRAVDVLKRLQVRVPLETRFALPSAVIFSQGNICKLLEATPSKVDNGCSATQPTP